MRFRVLLLALGVAAPLSAQEPAPPTPPPLWSGKGELSFVSTSGNSDTQTLGAGLEVPWSLASKSAVYAEELSFIDDLDRTSDWRIVNTGSLTADVSTVLALKLSFGILYSNEPVPGFKKRDTTTSAAVVAKF